MLVMTLLKVTLGCALLLILFRPTPTQASALYRCTGNQGEVVFSSTKVGYHDCKQLSSYASAPSHPAPNRVAYQEVTSLAWVKGWVDTTAQPIAPLVASLAGVQGGAETTAKISSVVTDTSSPSANTDKPPSHFMTFRYYGVVRADGSKYFGDVIPTREKGDVVTTHVELIPTCVACDLHSPIHWDTVHLNTTDYASIIHQASLESGVDEAFIRAIIHAESAFNPHAMSLKGAQGLMQLMPLTANDMGVADAFDPEQNIRGGVRYLSLLLKYFNGDRRLTAAAYNAGPAAVQHYNGVPPFAETQVYVERVGELLQRYDKALHPPLPASM
jgi:Transglycosylase SLT domain